MKKITLILSLFITINVSAQHISRIIYNCAGLPIGKDSLKINSTIGDSIISRTTFQFIKDLTDNSQLDFTNTNGNLTATIQSGAITDAMLASPKQNELVSGTTIKTVNGSSLLGSGNLSIAAGAGGSNNQVQYNNTGTLAGATNVEIDGGNLKVNGQTFSLDREYLKYGDNNFQTNLQGTWADVLDQNVSALSPINGNAAAGVGFGTWTLGTGTTLLSVGLTATNLYNRLPKIIIRNATSATTSIASYRETYQRRFRGNVAGAGGWYYKTKFGFHEGNTVTTARSFVGFINSTAVPTDVEPSSLFNIIGVGFDAADANFQVICNDGAGVATKVDTGISVPTTTQNRIFYLETFAEPNGSNVEVIFKELSNVDGSQIASFTTTISSNLPANTTYLSNQYRVSCGGTACIPAISVFGLYINGNF
jgi:hypothetical protein